MKPYVYLVCAIVLEVIGTNSLKASDGFTKLWFSLLTAAAYTGSFYCLSLTLRSINLAVAYALWSALGIVLTGLGGYLIFRQRLDGPALLGIGLIVAGVAVISLFSKTLGH